MLAGSCLAMSRTHGAHCPFAQVRRRPFRGTKWIAEIGMGSVALRSPSPTAPWGWSIQFPLRPFGSSQSYVGSRCLAIVYTQTTIAHPSSPLPPPRHTQTHIPPSPDWSRHTSLPPTEALGPGSASCALPSHVEQGFHLST